MSKGITLPAGFGELIAAVEKRPPFKPPDDGAFTAAEYAKKRGVCHTTALRHLNQAVNEGRVERMETRRQRTWDGAVLSMPGYRAIGKRRG